MPPTAQKVEATCPPPNRRPRERNILLPEGNFTSHVHVHALLRCPGSRPSLRKRF